MTLNWPIWLFGVTMVGLVAGYFLTRMALFIPLVALVLYLGVEFNLTDWAVWVFWITVILALLFIPLALFWNVRKFITFFGSIALAVAILAVSFGTWSWEDSRFGDEDTTATAVTTTTTESTTTTIPADDLGLTEEESQQIADDLGGIYQDFEPGEVVVGTGNIPDSPEERAPSVSFTKETIETREDLVAFFASDHKLAAAAGSQVEQALRTAGYGDEEVQLALTSGERWIWVSPTVEHQILGTTYALNGDIVKSENWRQVAPNDAIWFYVTSDAHIVAGASVRADCGNPKVDKVRPVRPDTPEAPPIEVPPGENCPFNPALPVDSPNCLKPKDPSKDVLLNPEVPEQVRGPGTTPVGTDPGPATPACDTPTGYCSGSGPATTTTRPSGSGGSGGGGSTPTTVPGCGSAGQPSCNNTGVSPPTTQAPPPAPPDTSSPDVTVPSP